MHPNGRSRDASVAIGSPESEKSTPDDRKVGVIPSSAIKEEALGRIQGGGEVIMPILLLDCRGYVVDA